MKQLTWKLLVIGINVCATAQNASLPKSDRAPEIRLKGDVVQLPLVMVNEYPFVEGEVSGVKGKFLLDTGAEQALALNDHRIPIVGGETIGTGHFGSGQTFAVRMNESISNVRVESLSFPKVTHVQSQNGTLLEQITPDFLGWIGYYLWQGYALKLDYKRGQATFYKDGPDSYLRGEKVLAVLPFELRKLPNQPLVPVQLGPVTAIGAFDTGQYGCLYASDAAKAKLISAGILQPVNAEENTYNVASFVVAGARVDGLKIVAVDPATFGAAVPIGITEPTILTLGYSFLRQYKTVWDYSAHKIYLLER